MNKQLQKARDYLDEVLGAVEGASGWGEPWLKAGQLPYYLQDLYTFEQAKVLGKPCLFMICRTTNGETPAVVRKHWQVLSKRFVGDVIYLVGAVTSFNRKRLIEQKVPFIVPGNQLYLPMLGLDLREHFKPGKQPEKKWFSAAAQVLILRELLGHSNHYHPAKELAQLLGYSAMTLTRAIKELTDTQLAIAERVGREKRLSFVLSGQNLWQAAKHQLHTPVKKRVWVAELSHSSLLNRTKAKMAGESALANNTLIADPKNCVVAVNASDWPEIKESMVLKEREQRDADCINVELWRYRPDILTTDNNVVDPLSLWLSLHETEDERIEMALGELLEKVWSHS